MKYMVVGFFLEKNCVLGIKFIILKFSINRVYDVIDYVDWFEFGCFWFYFVLLFYNFYIIIVNWLG